MRFKQRAFLCVFFVFRTVFTFSQNSTIDSLEKLAGAAPSDSLKSLALIELASNYFGYDTVKCDVCLQKAYDLLDKTNRDYNRGYYYEAKAQIVFNRGKYEQALVLADSAVLFYKKAEQGQQGAAQTNTAFQLAVTIADKGAAYATMGKQEDAIQFYLEGLHLYEQLDHPEKMRKTANCYNNIATLYFGMGQYEKGLAYDVKAIPFHVAAGDKESISFAYIFAASDFSMLKQFDSAESYFIKAEPYVKALNKPSVNIEYYGKTGVLYRTEKNWPKAIEQYTIAYENARQLNDIFNQAAYLRGIADSYYYDDQLLQAESFGLKALQLTEANNLVKEKIRLYQLLSLIYSRKKDFQQAYAYLQKYVAITVSTNEADLKKKINELDAKYQSEKKEKDILQLQKEKEVQSLSIQQKSTLNYVLAASLAGIVLIGFLAYRNFRSRQRLARQQDKLQQLQISELEKDRQLVTIDSMLKGQEEERSRLAKDLHDGLGGLLSGVKFSLSNMKDNLFITPDNMTVFERSLDMLDTSISELRRVAHNMMPEMLTRFGLDEALKEYCRTINTTHLVLVKYQSLGMDIRIEKPAEIIIYRIIQELMNNIMKHAAATEAIVQLIREEGRLSIMVEDNGKGFDTALLKNNTGMGLTSIQSRVDYLKGRLDIHSAAGKGTLVNIEFNI
jgi:signal transduction histidine kinase